MEELITLKFSLFPILSLTLRQITFVRTLLTFDDSKNLFEIVPITQ